MRSASVVMSDGSEDAEVLRQQRRRARLLGEEDEEDFGMGSSFGGFDDIFAELRAEEEAAVAAGEAAGKAALRDEVGPPSQPPSPPQRGNSGRPSSSNRGRGAARRGPNSSPVYLGEPVTPPPLAYTPPSPPSWALPLYDTADTAQASSTSYASSYGSTSGTTSGADWQAQMPAASRRGGGLDSNDGIERASVGQLVTLIPTKVMVFIDGMCGLQRSAAASC